VSQFDIKTSLPSLGPDRSGLLLPRMAARLLVGRNILRYGATRFVPKGSIENDSVRVTEDDSIENPIIPLFCRNRK
jgi:hypothetical protein